jgi:hypothetical protein
MTHTKSSNCGDQKNTRDAAKDHAKAAAAEKVGVDIAIMMAGHLPPTHSTTKVDKVNMSRTAGTPPSLTGRTERIAIPETVIASETNRTIPTFAKVKVFQ